MPIKGPEPHLLANIHSILKQDYNGAVQLVLAFQDAQDPELLRVKSFLANRQTRVEITILEGLSRLGANPKNSNLLHAMSAAKHDWIYVGDADTCMDQDHLQVNFAAVNGNTNKFSTAVTVHQNPQTLGASLECIGTNTEFVNYFLLSHMSPQSGALNGASQFFHRSLLEKVGGFQAYLNSITDDIALQVQFVEAGASAVLVPRFVRVKLEQQTLKGFWQRQQRWQLIVLCYKPFLFFCLAPTSWVWQWLAVAAAISGSVFTAQAALAIVAVRVIRSFIFQIQLSAPPRDWLKCVVLPIYDVLSPLIWVTTLTVRKVKWAGFVLEVQRDGKLIHLES